MTSKMSEKSILRRSIFKLITLLIAVIQ